jgi:hypothetical protein
MTGEMNQDLINCIARDIINDLVNDNGYIPYLPDLRGRFSATSEEVLAGVRLADRFVALYSGGVV